MIKGKNIFSNEVSLGHSAFLASSELVICSLLSMLTFSSAHSNFSIKNHSKSSKTVVHFKAWYI